MAWALTPAIYGQESDLSTPTDEPTANDKATVEDQVMASKTERSVLSDPDQIIVTDQEISGKLGWHDVEQTTKQADSLDMMSIKEEPYDPLAPARAAFYSAVLPGLGQAYNKKYWKIPIVYGGIAAGVYFYQRNTEDYNRFRDAYKRRLAGYQDDEFQGVSDARLRDAQKTAGRNRDVSLAMAIGVYLLNILDANVDAHLLRYNLNEDLTIRPNYQYETHHRPSVYGLSLNISLP